MGFIGIGAALALLLALLTLRAKAQHDRVVRLIHQTPVTPIADLVQSFTARTDPASPTHAAVQGRVVPRETTRLTAPITGSSCVAYKVRVYEPGDDENPDQNYFEDSKWVPWAVDDGTGLALAPFNPFEPPKGYRHPYYWPGRVSTGDTFKDNTPHHTPPNSLFGRSLVEERLQALSILPGQEREEPSPSSSPLDSFISHYGREHVPSLIWDRSDQDLSWQVSILKEFGNEVFLLGPCTVQEGCAHFQLGSDSLLWFGRRADALSHEQLSARRSARWAKIWFIVFVILSVAYLHFA